MTPVQPAAQRHRPQQNSRHGHERKLKTDVADPCRIPQQHAESGRSQSIQPHVFRSDGQRGLQQGAHHGGPHGAGRETGRGDIEPHRTYGQRIAHQMTAPQQRQPPQRQVGQEKNKARMQTRHSQQMRHAAARPGCAQPGRQTAPVGHRHGPQHGSGIVRRTDPLHPCGRTQMEPRIGIRPALKHPARGEVERPDETPPRHQPPVTLRTAPQGPHPTPAKDAVAAREHHGRIGPQHHPVGRRMPLRPAGEPPRPDHTVGRTVTSAAGGHPLDLHLPEARRLQRDRPLRCMKLADAPPCHHKQGRQGRTRTQQQRQNAAQRKSRGDEPPRQREMFSQDDSCRERKQQFYHREGLHRHRFK